MSGRRLIGASWLASTLGVAACQPAAGLIGLPDGAVAHVTLVTGGEATVFVDLSRDRAGPRVRAAVGRLEIGSMAPSPLGSDESTHHAGPGEGFHLRRTGDRLELLRPRGDEARWMPVLQGIGHLDQVTWVNTGRLSTRDRQALDTRLKEVVPLDVQPGEAQVDGDLSEWVGAAAQPVERPSQVLSGKPDWGGPRDAAFGMAARATAGGLVMALRVRDDAHVSGSDRLEILAPDRVIRLPLPDRAGSLEGSGWTAAFSEPDWLGQGVELRFEGAGAQALLQRPPVVQLVDVDPGEGEVRLGSAASAELGSLAAAD